MTVFDEAYNSVAMPSMIDLHGESIGWRASSLDSTRTISALVDRNPPTPLDGALEGVSFDVVVTVYNDSTLGVSSSELDEGTNEILVSPRDGATAVWMSVRMIDHDSGVMRLGCNGG